ncbi:hypothetical protein, partial [Domibacillus tundrae]|uniref:hypothetical protein n=1 Tax=Domibacillus tundrae TaxID=1587527 RepID=UPI00339354F5
CCSINRNFPHRILGFGRFHFDCIISVPSEFMDDFNRPMVKIDIFLGQCYFKTETNINNIKTMPIT